MAEMSGEVERSPGIAVVLTTVANRETGERLGRQLIEERLIACANLVPGLVSLYRWEGEIACEDEVLVLMKVPSNGVERLFARIGELHPYTVPELIALPSGSVSQAYSRWVQESAEVDR